MLQSKQALPKGTHLHKHYEIMHTLGKGDFGITYLAKDKRYHKRVVIKELFLPEYFEREEDLTVVTERFTSKEFTDFKKVFYDEAARIKEFHQQGIVPITHIFEQFNTVYYVTGFIHGTTLHEWVMKTGPISEHDAQIYAEYMAFSLGELHENGILHLNITPDNILISNHNIAVLAGFGVARDYVYEEVLRKITKLTPYASIECYVIGDPQGPFSDVYALGASLYYALTSCIPATPYARMDSPLIEPIKLNHNISQHANDAIMKAMAMKPSDRYQSMEEFIFDFYPDSRKDYEKLHSRKKHWNIFRNLFDL